MPISGVVIRCKHVERDAVITELADYSSLEIHHRLDDGSLVAVLDSISVENEVETISRIMQLAGVLDVRLAYHNFEDLVPETIN
jgi:nitrate reductase NapAB chaperone NapD